MLCVSCLFRGRGRVLASTAKRVCSRAGAETGAGGDSPLRRLLDDAGTFGEAAPADEELRWATQPYAAPRPVGAAPARPEPEPAPATVLLFPGQGSQFVGMGRALSHLPKARELYELASTVLGWDVWRVCTEGPEEELSRHCQPAVLVTSLAALERAREERPGALQAARAAAGFSLGELTALVYAGALPIEQALRVAEVREAAMRAAAADRAGGMLTVWLAPDADVPALLRRARDAAAERGVAAPVCQVANYLFPGCKVIAGDEEALKYVEAMGRSLGVRRSARVRVAGAFHSALMAPARAPVEAALRLCEVGAPRLRVWAGAEARVYRDARDVRRGLARLAAAPLRWEQTLHAVFARPRPAPQPLVLAVGPGAAGLRATLRQVNARAWDRSLQVDV